MTDPVAALAAAIAAALRFDERRLDGDRAARAAAAADPALPQELQGRLASDPSTHVRRVLAGRPDIDRQVAATLAADRQALVRRVAARNPAVPTARLRHGDPDPWVRRAIAQRPDTDPATATRMATQDPDPEVRRIIFSDMSRDLPEEVLVLGERDTSESVREAVQRRRNASVVRKLRKSLASNR